MTEIAWLSVAGDPAAFPPVSDALCDPDGLLAAGGDLTPQRLLTAYVRGIFPWYEEGQPILWWSPDPRAVLWPDDLHVSRSLARTLRKTDLRFSADTAFDAVIEGCAAPRAHSSGTWITADMIEAYRRLHRLGWAHAFEGWIGENLVAGLYGVAIGRVFFAESMFTRVNDASKAVLVKAVKFLQGPFVRTHRLPGLVGAPAFPGRNGVAAARVSRPIAATVLAARRTRQLAA